MAVSDLKRSDWNKVSSKHRRRIDVATVIHYWELFGNEKDIDHIKRTIYGTLEPSNFFNKYINGISEESKKQRLTCQFEDQNVVRHIEVITNKDKQWFESYRKDMSKITPYSDDSKSINEYLEPCALSERDGVELPFLMNIKFTRSFIDLDELLRKLKLDSTHYPEQLDRIDVYSKFKKSGSFPTRKIQFVIEAHDYIFGANGVHLGKDENRTKYDFTKMLLDTFFVKFSSVPYVQYVHKDYPELIVSPTSLDKIYEAITPDEPAKKGKKPTT